MTADVPAKSGPERIGEARNATKADVWLVKEAGRRVVVKTIANRRKGPGRALAARLLRREARMLEALRGVPGVPVLLEADAEKLVIEHRPGRNLFERRKRGISSNVAAHIQEVVAGLHERGFAHGDIGRRDVIVTGDGEVTLVDFATAIGPGSPPFLWRLLLPLWRHRDRARVAKLLERYRRRWDRRVAARTTAGRPVSRA